MQVHYPPSRLAPAAGMVALAALLFGTAGLTSQVSAAPAAKAPEPAPEWIWSNRNPRAGEQVFFRRAFELPREVVAASVTVTCDNWHRLWVNGKDLGASGEWSAPARHDLAKLLVPGGRNVIAVAGRNEGGAAAMALRLSASLKDGAMFALVSDQTWRCSPREAAGWLQAGLDDSGWDQAVVVGRMGDPPWGEVIEGSAAGNGVPRDMTGQFQVAKGFRLERIYQVPKTRGSWVAMTVDGTGKLLCADQYGKIHRVTPAGGPDGETTSVPTAIPLHGAHGLLWHAGALYVTVNEGGDQSGVWRVADTNGDGEPDEPRLLKAMNGRGEHGPHGLTPSPDGQWIYLIAGNHTDLPPMDASLVPKVWAEDQLLPRRPDANGHAADRMAPGGWIARFKPDGSRWELISIGYRNAYDLAFLHTGDLFTYDADMEWDLGMPWYRPTRICHVTPGSEFGWRNGTGKWPDYYEDSMPSQLDIGPGSPTGVLSGVGAKFPAKYQRALFALDWTFATIRAIHLTPGAGGYQATSEEFVAGSGMPLTDAVIGADGAMYFLTGGRRADSALWRVTYTGGEPVQAVPQQHKEQSLAPLAGAWAGLGSADRVTRFQSRTALETAGAAEILPRLAAERDPWRVIGACLALARVGDAAQRKLVLGALCALDWPSLDAAQRINWLRACGLVFIRGGEPSAAERAAVLEKIDTAFPSNQRDLDRELCRLLSYLQAPGIVGRTLALMDGSGPAPAPDWLAVAKRNSQYGGPIEAMIRNLPPAQVIHYIYCLRVVKGPWSVEERKRFFAWFDRLLLKSGGNSYAGFIRDLRKQTLDTCTPEEVAWISKLPQVVIPHPLADLPPVTGPGREWTVEEVAQLAASGLAGRDRANGQRMFRASLCVACHRFGAEGGSAGPDLSAVAGRFTARDLAEAILEPGKVISDQFTFDTITLDDGSQLVGKRIEEKDGRWLVATSAFDFSVTTAVESARIKDIRHSPVSPMPAGLVNRLNPDELKDLLAYLLEKPESAGQPR